jgi:hypothetical protein
MPPSQKDNHCPDRDKARALRAANGDPEKDAAVRVAVVAALLLMVALVVRLIAG